MTLKGGCRVNISLYSTANNPIFLPNQNEKAVTIRSSEGELDKIWPLMVNTITYSFPIKMKKTVTITSWPAAQIRVDLSRSKDNSERSSSEKVIALHVYIMTSSISIIMKRVWKVGAEQQPWYSWPLKVTGWPWKVSELKCYAITHLHHHIFHCYQNQKALIIMDHADQSRQRLWLTDRPTDPRMPANSYVQWTLPV